MSESVEREHCPCWYDDANWRGHGLTARFICSCSGQVAIRYPDRERRAEAVGEEPDDYMAEAAFQRQRLEDWPRG